MSTLWLTLRFIPKAFRAFPWLLTERLHLTARSAHRPEDVGEDRRYCLRCRVPAPCPEFMRATEAVYDARVKVADILGTA